MLKIPVRNVTGIFLFHNGKAKKGVFYLKKPLAFQKTSKIPPTNITVM